MRKKNYFIKYFTLVLMTLLFLTISLEAQNNVVKKIRFLRPDLTINEVSISRVSGDLNQNTVKIVMKLSNRIKDSRANNFTVKISKKDPRIPDRGGLRNRMSISYTTVSEFTVNRLVGTMLSRGRGMSYITREITDSIPIGMKYKYKVEIDSKRQVIESNERNNVKYSEDYFSRCSSFDLALTQVEVDVTETGDIKLRAKGRERCFCNCIFGDVEFVFTEVGDDGGIAMGAGPGRSGARYQSGGWIPVGRFDLAGGMKGFDVKIGVRGITELNMTNNTYRVLVRSTERGIRTINLDR